MNLNFPVRSLGQRETCLDRGYQVPQREAWRPPNRSSEDLKGEWQGLDNRKKFWETIKENAILSQGSWLRTQEEWLSKGRTREVAVPIPYNHCRVLLRDDDLKKTNF